MTLIAVRLRDPDGFPERITDDVDGRSGERSWRVNTANPSLALTAIGLPARGTIWSIDEPGLLVRIYNTIPMGGTDDIDGEGGWTRIQVIYGGGGGGVIAPIPAIGNDWTESLPGVSGVTVYTGVGAAKCVNLNDGRGFTKEVGHIDFRVHQFITIAAAAGYNWGRLYQLMRGTVNDAKVDLPNFLNLGFAMVLAKGQARYRAFSTGQPAEGVVEISHEIVGREDHIVRWTVPDPKGVPVCPVPDIKTAPIYEDDDYAGLF